MTDYLHKKNEIIGLFFQTLNKARLINEGIDLINFVNAAYDYSVLELFAGAGGLAFGFEKAGLKCIALNELDPLACQTLRQNRTEWKVLEGDIKDISFVEYANKAHVVAGGFPCQSFRHAGNRLGLKDARGTLFYEFAWLYRRLKPLICLGENVHGLLHHGQGKTLKTMIAILDEIGYNVVPHKILNAVNYGAPQKRERIFLVGVRKDNPNCFEYPKPIMTRFNLRRAKKGKLVLGGCSFINRGKISNYKEKNTRPCATQRGLAGSTAGIQKEYMGNSYFSSGRKTGMSRRIG